MTSSPPKPPASSRPPAAPGSADAGRRITALAAGGSVLLLSASAVALWPRTYGTEATFVVEGSPVVNAAALASRVESTLLERDELARVAIELPAELRSPDPIGRLRAGIRVQSRGPLGYVVEFRGSEPKSVQRITNLLAERAVALTPKLAAPPQDLAAAQALADRTRAVTEFLTAHPEVTLEASSEGKAASGPESGLETLRTEKRRIEQRLATGATDNPYADANQSPEILNRRLAEHKSTIARRESALKDLKPASPPTVSPELVAQWRQLLAELATAQAAALTPGAAAPPTTARLTARAPLPKSPITPNRLVLSLVGLLLSVAAGLIAYVLPRRPEHAGRRTRSTRSGPPEPMSPLAPGVARSDPPRPRSEPPPQRSEPPPPFQERQSSSPPPRPSEPPSPVLVQRTVVLGAQVSPAPAASRTRSQTAPGGLEAPAAQAAASYPGAGVTVPASAHGPPAAPLFGSRPPPGAGSYSVSSSHPPPMDSQPGGSRVERLSPLQSAHPPLTAPVTSGASSSRRDVSAPPAAASAPQIVSRPPALDPEAESWASHFEPPPPEPTRPTHPQPSPEPTDGEGTRKRAGRWKTQVMGSMVPLEVMAARGELPPPHSEPLESVRSSARPVARQVPSPSATTIVQYDVPLGWAPTVDSRGADTVQLRDAVLRAATGRSITLLVTGSARADRGRAACALALALAEAGARTLLLEADFDHPEIHRVLSISPPPGAGFSQQLMARRAARQVEPWTVIRCSASLVVLPEGRFRSPGLVLSREFEGAVTDLAEQHHILLVHAPSLAQPDDLRPLGALAQGVILVEHGKPSQLRVGDQPLRGLV